MSSNQVNIYNNKKIKINNITNETNTNGGEEMGKSDNSVNNKSMTKENTKSKIHISEGNIINTEAEVIDVRNKRERNENDETLKIDNFA